MGCYAGRYSGKAPVEFGIYLGLEDNPEERVLLPGKQVPEGKKSVTLRLTIGSAEKTLTSQEIEACAASAVKRLAKHVGAELRGK